MNLKVTFIIGASAANLLTPGSAAAEVILTEQAALARAFPEGAPARRTLYLDPRQVAAVERLARSKVPSPVVTTFRGRSASGEERRAILDTHVVRTMPETVMAVVGGGGRLNTTLVLQFSEPPDYLPREGWLKTLEGKVLDEELWPSRGVRRVSGSTLTVQALTEAVRRCLAIDELVLRGHQ
jgi:hypothetical protein